MISLRLGTGPGTCYGGMGVYPGRRVLSDVLLSLCMRRQAAALKGPCICLNVYPSPFSLHWRLHGWAGLGCTGEMKGERQKGREAGRQAGRQAGREQREKPS